MGIKERRERERQGIRDGILAAAREVASGEGWRSVTIRKIAGRIEYSPPVIYEHFESKDGILLELMRMGYAEQLGAVEAAAKSASGPEEALLDMARAWLDFAFRSPDLYQVMYGLGGVPFSPAETRKEGEKIVGPVERVIRKIPRKDGKTIEDAEGKVTLLWATVHGLVALTMVGRIPGGQEEAHIRAEQATRDYITAWQNG